MNESDRLFEINIRSSYSWDLFRLREKKHTFKKRYWSFCLIVVLKRYEHEISFSLNVYFIIHGLPPLSIRIWMKWSDFFLFFNIPTYIPTLSQRVLLSKEFYYTTIGTMIICRIWQLQLRQIARYYLTR